MKNFKAAYIPTTLRGAALFLALLLGNLQPVCADLASHNLVSSEGPIAPTPPSHPAGVVSLHGELKVIGTKLCDKNGTPIQLKGMSAHQLQNYPWTTSTVVNLIK